MKKVLALLVLCALSIPAFAEKAKVKIINQSKWEIHHLFMSSTEEESWGPDQLEDEILVKGDSITVTDIPCGEYDIKVVDEDGDECIIEAVDLCRDESYWKITDKDLLECEGYD
jgi:hypothetical protein